MVVFCLFLRYIVCHRQLPWHAAFLLFKIFNLQVIRDVIGVHMEELSSQWQEENRLDNAEMCEGGKTKSSGRYVTDRKDVLAFMRNLLRGQSSLTACNVILFCFLYSTYRPQLRHMQFIVYQFC